jgi:hypothetical protein
VADICCGFKYINDASPAATNFIADNWKLTGVAMRFCHFVSEINDPLALNLLERNIANSENFFTQLASLADHDNIFTWSPDVDDVKEEQSFKGSTKMLHTFNNINEATGSLSRLLGLADRSGFLSHQEGLSANLDLSVLLEKIEGALDFGGVLNFGDIDFKVMKGDQDDKDIIQGMLKANGVEGDEVTSLIEGICSLLEMKKILGSLRTDNGRILNKLVEHRDELKKLMDSVNTMISKSTENSINSITDLKALQAAKDASKKTEGEKSPDREKASNAICNLFKNTKEFTTSKLTPVQNLKESDNSVSFVAAIRKVIPDADKQEVAKILKTFKDKQWIAFTGRINVEKIPEGTLRNIGKAYNQATSHVAVSPKEARKSASECYASLKDVANGDIDEVVFSPSMVEYIVGCGCGLSSKNLLPIIRNIAILAGENKKKAEQFTDSLLYKFYAGNIRAVELDGGGISLSRSLAKARVTQNPQQTGKRVFRAMSNARPVAMSI